LGNYTCFVGSNGAGKSSILTALNIFFRNSTDSSTNILALDEEDFHNKNIRDAVTITVTFTDLSPEAQSEFSAYYRNDRLIVSSIARWDANAKNAPVQQFGQRRVMKTFAPFFDAEGDGVKVSDLKIIYEKIRLQYPGLPSPGSKPAMKDALRQYEEAHPDELSLEPSADQFYGFGGKAKSLLEKYVQWVFVPAVKDATTEQFESKRTAIGQILERTLRSKMSFAPALDKIREEASQQYAGLLEEHAKSLEALASALTKKVRDWAHPDATIELSWQNDSSKVSISEPMAEVLAGEGLFTGHLSRFGHGLQRSFLLALLQELAAADITSQPTLLLACEEPELYQHPPQIRHLASVLDELANQGSQVFVCTHSPLFVRGEQCEEIRLVTKERKKGESRARFVDFESLSQAVGSAGGIKPLKATGTMLKVGQALQPDINEMFFASFIVLVEGLEDVAYISTYLVLSELWQEFRRLGGHVVPCDGKSRMILPLAIARAFEIPTFVVFDADSDKCDRPDRRTMHTKNNATLLSLCGIAGQAPLPDAAVWSDGLLVWKEDLAADLAAGIGKEEWDRLRDRVKRKYDLDDVSDVYKSTFYIQCFLADMWDAGRKCPALQKLCEAIISFARIRVG